MTNVSCMVDPKDIPNCEMCPTDLATLGLPNGGNVTLFDPESNKIIACQAVPSPAVMSASINVSNQILASLGFNGLEVIVALPAQVVAPVATPQPLAPSLTPMPTPAVPAPAAQMPAPQMAIPQPAVPAPVAQMPAPQMAIPQPGGMPAMGTMPAMGGMPAPGMPQPGGMPAMGGMQQQGMGMMAPADPHPNKIDVNSLQQTKNMEKGAAVTVSVNPGTNLDGKVVISQNNANLLNIYPGALIGWEDPLTRSTGSARVAIAGIPDTAIRMEDNTKFDTKVEAPQIVIYSLEPPIVHVEVKTLELEGKPNYNGYLEINTRTGMELQMNEGDIIAFEDDLTGAFGAGKLRINPAVPDGTVFIDQELIEASGVGSFEVEVKKNVREIIPLQSLNLGVSPISGDDVWAVISQARQNIGMIKQWLGNYTIYKGIKLRYAQANAGLEVLSTVPELSGDVLASVNANTSVNLSPTGLVTFNAILVIDISRSMMARDVEVTNIGPALEGIKAAMHDKEIIKFLDQFKPGIYVPRRVSAAFGAILFLSEKVGRGFGEKVSIVRFADEAQTLPMGSGVGGKWMDSSSGAKGELEATARRIVNDIGNAYGQATNMAPAMVRTQELVNAFKEQEGDNPQPTMIVLLTDGVPTDPDEFYQSIDMIAQNDNIVLYIIGLGNPDDEGMKRAAAMCGGEYFKPEDSGELLTWYSKRARDLTVKIRRE